MEPLPGNQSPRVPAVSPADQAALQAQYDAAIAYLYGRINYEKTADTAPYPFRLRRMNELLERFDLHDICGRQVPLVHIAGTKGKGSTSTMVAAMLSAGGYRTGLYTSPHLEALEERFVVDGEMPTQQEMIVLIRRLQTVAEELAHSELGPPTFFEMTTAIALLYFQARNCDAVVLEVGLGGRLDSTNVCRPTVTAITSIGFDHQHILGHTLREIATQKAGIIKPQIPIISGVIQPEARAAIEDIAAQTAAPLFAIDTDFRCNVHEPSATSDWGTCFDMLSNRHPLRSRYGWKVPLDGRHQALNASTALAIMDHLDARHVSVSLADQQRGLLQTRLAGRVERFPLSPVLDVILDTSHNVDSIRALCQCIQQRAAGRPVTIVFGTSKDKEHREMLVLLAEHADQLILTRYHGNPRYREPQELLQALPSGHPAAVMDDPLQAVKTAVLDRQAPRLVVVCGSFFLAAEVRPWLRSQRQDNLPNAG